jgi:hypothetical protein
MKKLHKVNRKELKINNSNILENLWLFSKPIFPNQNALTDNIA